MEMLESVALPAIVLDKTSPCWFCEEKNDSAIRNSETEDPASPEGEDEGPENGEHNDASVLGGNLGSRPTWNISHKVEAEDPIEAGVQTEIVPAAHHLLPGNASVKKATLLHKYMVWEGKNPKGFKGPIGYDINNASNGVWLPGNYAVRVGTDFGQNWGQFNDPFKEAYALAAMRSAGNLQLHDAHPAYNANVRSTLLDIAKKLDALWTDRSKCPVCDKDLKDQLTPPYGLVGRLNALSAEHKKALIFTAHNRKAINNGYYTSSRVLGVYG
ncbi:MAG TPA: AHH domain-containing protein [Povalibacter sp.]|uniref:AHH domain-containing protein n=1 Tax=Povalibacter sp. TaxID=1962978 RepID=UPI002B7B477D|nr:AHH domain-containing protein [Povalibacter sp.]HMN43947.1 AHH domain-containing protein [Povalibacter sp.]